ncbi:ABC transporter substrate-binding protein [Bordetella sp. N]|uniref:ABC transporter substrate-binding protein n=1 Tax=Bordetella sp. N TaxID=1746199 RepID=UPI00070BFA5F|nr:ABC transporter substrate-binding protein [Bordetella sp. N]ALM82238.1 hypothetical protein ASB57_04040 [Bordetella sp. N]
MTMTRRTALKATAAALLLTPGMRVLAATDDSLTVVLTSDIRGLMPGSGPDIASGTVRQQIYEGLVCWRADGSVAPMLAQSITPSEDGKRYKFVLRSGVRFHNGAPLTAKEVAWTWERYLDPKTAWAGRATFDGSNGIKVVAVHAIDDMTVEFELAAPSAAFLSALARADLDSTGIAHPDCLDSTGAWKQAIGTGPYRLKEWRPKELVELERFEGYQSRSEAPDGLAGAKKPLVQRVILRVVPDPSTAAAGVRSGALDLYSDVPPDLYGTLKNANGVRTSTVQTASVLTIPIQTRDPLLSDARIRQALSKSLDRQALVQALTEGTSRPTASLVPPTSKLYGEVQKRGMELDLDGARKLLAEAGYRGQPITLLTSKQNVLMSNTAVACQGLWQAAGINVQIEVMEFAALYDRYYSGRYQMLVWNVTAYLDPIFVFDRFIGDKNKQVDRVWDDAGARQLLHQLFEAGDDATRQKLADALHELYLAQMPMLVWSSRGQIDAVGPRVDGYAGWPGSKPRLWNVSVKGKAS